MARIASTSRLETLRLRLRMTGSKYFKLTLSEKSFRIVVHVVYEHGQTLLKTRPPMNGRTARYTRALLARPRFALIAVALIVSGLLLPVMLKPSSSNNLLDGQSFDLQTGEAVTVAHQPDTDAATATASPIPPVDNEILTTARGNQIPGESQLSPDIITQEVVIEAGDTLDRIFKRMGLSPQLLHAIIHHDDNTKTLASLKVGETLYFDLTPAAGLKTIKRTAGMDQWLIVNLDNETVSAELQPRQMTYNQVSANGIITGNLFNAGKQAGMRDNTIIALAKIFGWDIDFALDIRRGDRFSLVYEEIWRDGEYLRDGEIIAARFVNQGDTYDALRFDDGENVDYYSPDGRPMRKAFLRAPVDFTRISDSFNPRRLHPILKRVRPHNGIDYAAPAGTPVYAAGSGRVIRSSYTAPNGHHVFIDHANGVVTKYLHFTKRAVSLHERVKQGDVIGYVGATGLATAPHLHYEFIVDGIHRNPRTVKLPSVEPLSSDKIEQMQHQHSKILQQIAQLDNEMAAASATASTATP